MKTGIAQYRPHSISILVNPLAGKPMAPFNNLVAAAWQRRVRWTSLFLTALRGESVREIGNGSRVGNPARNQTPPPLGVKRGDYFGRSNCV